MDSVTPAAAWSSSRGEVYVLTKDEGGRHSPFFSNYRPQFYFRTTDVTGVIELPEGVGMVQPGDHATFTVELIQPIAMEEGLTFAVREGGHTVSWLRLDQDPRLIFIRQESSLELAL